MKYAYKNALAHYKTAHLLSKSINYGMANAHLILAGEECIKSYMISMKMIGRCEDTVFNSIFKYHREKHETIRETYDTLYQLKVLF